MSNATKHKKQMEYKKSIRTNSKYFTSEGNAIDRQRMQTRDRVYKQHMDANPFRQHKVKPDYRNVDPVYREKISKIDNYNQNIMDQGLKKSVRQANAFRARKIKGNRIRHIL